MVLAFAVKTLAQESPVSLVDFSISTPATPSVATARAIEFFQAELVHRGLRELDASGARANRVLVGTVKEFRDAGIATDDLPVEGYRLKSVRESGGLVVQVVGADARGVLFGMGRLVRELRVADGQALLPATLDVRSAPQYPLRGVQLGFRAMSNSYGSWTVEQFDRQIRDLILYGVNAIELVAGFSNERTELLSRPAPEMMREVAKLAAYWDLDVWLWTPAREHDYSDPAAVAKTLREWEELFRLLPRLDGIFVPGGDPGEAPPSLLIPLVEKQAQLVKQYHPNTKVWMSAQSFGRDALKTFLDYLTNERPKWLTGVISAPWTELSTEALRKAVPPEYPVRLCADIGHVIHCQYPVPNFDIAFAIAQGREPICPRPEGMQQILAHELPATIGGIAYSDGVTDDVNKILWLALAWDPSAKPAEIMADYGRTYLGAKLGDRFGAGLVGLEQNWRGPVATNRSIEKVFAEFVAMEAQASPELRNNWRFLSGLYRAYYDHYVYQRVRSEGAAETQVNAWLRTVTSENMQSMVKHSDRLLDETAQKSKQLPERARILEIGDALNRLIGMKLSTARHGAVSTTRGANLDSLDWPLNNRRWLKQRFEEIAQTSPKDEQVRLLREIGSWNEAGEGGVLLTFAAGDERGAKMIGDFAKDPSGHGSTYVLTNWIRDREFNTHRIEWMNHLSRLGPAPVEIRLTGLDKSAEYELRVVYGEPRLRTEFSLTANGAHQIHGALKPDERPVPATYVLPREQTASGELLLRWERDPVAASIKGVPHISELRLKKRAQ
ncbi:MAG: hypothetical protein NVV74_10170 [Magnetospirillum sp.]|nr:hypothetical protein [Magnetospirillum sp.]